MIVRHFIFTSYRDVLEFTRNRGKYYLGSTVEDQTL
jgi:hypothetical protein